MAELVEIEMQPVPICDPLALEEMDVIDEEEYSMEKEKEGEEEVNAANASRASAFFNVTNSIVGAGILSLPYAFSTMGIIQATLFFALFAFVSTITLQLVVQCAVAVNKPSFEETVESAFGPIISKFFQGVVIFSCYGTIIGYVVIIGDLLPPIACAWTGNDFPNDYWCFSPWFFQVVISAFVFLPLSTLKFIDSLKFASVLAIVAVFYFTFLVYIQGGQNVLERVQDTSEDSVQEIIWWNVSTDIFLGLPIIAFAFGGHLQSIPIYGELKEEHKTLKNWFMIACSSVGFLSVVYYSVGIISYIRFMPDIDGNILKQMLRTKPGNIPTQIASFAICVVVFFTYPLFSWNIRYSLDRIFFSKWTPLYHPGPESKTLAVQIRYYSLTLFIVVSALIIAIAADIKIVFGLTGAVGGVLIKLVFPVACYWKLGPLYRSKFHPDVPPELPLYQKIFLGFVFIGGIICGIISSTVIILSAFQ